MEKRFQFLMVFALLLLCAFSLLVWVPSLHGQFYFDDWPNLSGLSDISDERSFAAYVLSATSSMVGRPIAYLTFALQSTAWPDSPFQFKLINLSIHIVNGCLFFLVSFLALKLNRRSNKMAAICATLAAGVWLIHPLHASVVPYVVQRMTLLSSTFSLLAVIIYLVFRKREDIWGLKFILWVSLGIGLLSVGGILTKEIAVLTGLYILALEIIVDKSRPFRLFSWWLALISVIPVFGVFLLLFLMGHFENVESYRDFSIYERLITQSRVLFSYLEAIILPRPELINIYNDTFVISRGLFSPSWTILAIVGLSGITLLLVLGRSRLPWLLFGWIFFLFGHLLESTILPLELYFDHRNYLPMAGLILGVGVTLTDYASRGRAMARNTVVVLGGVYVTYLGAVAHAEAVIWSDPQRFAFASVSERPDSIRARQVASNYFMSVGDFDTSARLLFSIREKLGDSPGIMLQLKVIECFSPELLRLSSNELEASLRTGPRDRIAVEALYHLWETVRDGKCDSLVVEDITKMASALSSNPSYTPISENLSLVYAFGLADQGEFLAAAQFMAQQIDRFGPEYALLSARFFYAAGHEHEALETLAKISRKYEGNPRYELALKGKVEDVREAILQSREG